jgi:hypothetical protein
VGTLADDREPGSIESSGDALAGDREPCRGGKSVLWLMTVSLAGAGDDDSGLGWRVCGRLVWQTRLNLPRTLAEISLGA